MQTTKEVIQAGQAQGIQAGQAQGFHVWAQDVWVRTKTETAAAAAAELVS